MLYCTVHKLKCTGITEIDFNKEVSTHHTYKYRILGDSDPRREAIILYVIKHDGCNKTKLCDYMEELLEEKPPIYVFDTNNL